MSKNQKGNNNFSSKFTMYIIYFKCCYQGKKCKGRNEWIKKFNKANTKHIDSLKTDAIKHKTRAEMDESKSQADDAQKPQKNNA